MGMHTLVLARRPSCIYQDLLRDNPTLRAVLHRGCAMDAHTTRVCLLSKRAPASTPLVCCVNLLLKLDYCDAVLKCKPFTDGSERWEMLCTTRNILTAATSRRMNSQMNWQLTSGRCSVRAALPLGWFWERMDMLEEML